MSAGGWRALGVLSHDMVLRFSVRGNALIRGTAFSLATNALSARIQFSAFHSENNNFRAIYREALRCRVLVELRSCLSAFPCEPLVSSADGH